MRAAVLIPLLVAFALLAASTSARAATAAWQFTPVSAPPPPTGVAASTTPVPLGHVGQISFLTPNEGLLITGGTEGGTGTDLFYGGVVPAGVWAYNGQSWSELSSVCGGSFGRIAWVGPDEFWTIADQRPGQVVPSGKADILQSISLCHFLNGQVVASYAVPIDEPGAWQAMDAAACDGPDDCWFGGNDDTNNEAFELHWDGTNLTEVDDPYDHAIDSMVDYQGQIYQSVRLTSSDTPQVPENPLAPIERIEGTGFVPETTYGQGQLLPYYGSAPGASPQDLDGFALSTDGDPLGDNATQLWALAAGSQSPGQLTVLHQAAGGSWTQLAPLANNATLPSCTNGDTSLAALAQDPSSDPLEEPFDDGNGADTPPAISNSNPESGTATGAIAAMPGSDEAWLSMLEASGSGSAPEMVLIDDNGCIQQVDEPTDSVNLPSAFNVAFNGAAPGQSSPPASGEVVDCPAYNDCWMADADGWLYQYTDGTQYPVDTDPNLAGIISYRPPDGATVTTFSDIAPPDDSGDNSPAVEPPGVTKVVTTTTKGVTIKLTHVKAKVVHHDVLQLTFDLNTRARIQILAERHGTVVARSKREVLAAGRRTLTLTLNPKRWPNHLKVNATPVSASTKTTSTKKSGTTSSKKSSSRTRSAKTTSTKR